MLSIQALEDAQLLVIDYDKLHKLYGTSMAWQNIGRTIAEKEYFVMEQYASVLNNESAKEIVVVHPFRFRRVWGGGGGA